MVDLNDDCGWMFDIDCKISHDCLFIPGQI